MRERLIRLFEETGMAHHRVYVETDGYDPKWPQWYAAYLQPRMGELLHRTFSVDELTDLVLLLEARRVANPSEQPWPHVYADLLLEQLNGAAAEDKT